MARGHKTGGRKKGTPNKAATHIRALCAQHTEEMVLVILAIARDKKAQDKDRRAAADSILDRAHGRPAQTIVGGDDDQNPITIRMLNHVFTNPEDLKAYRASRAKAWAAQGKAQQG
jgi:hypothetical protein